MSAAESVVLTSSLREMSIEQLDALSKNQPNLAPDIIGELRRRLTLARLVLQYKTETQQS
jgi:hypothetical protein